MDWKNENETTGEEKCDGDLVTFQVNGGEGKEASVTFEALKTDLVKSSEVFATMFQGRFVESFKVWDKFSVEVNDTKEEEFSEFLRYSLLKTDY